MKNRGFKVIALALIVSFSFAFFGCGTASNWATQKNDTKMNELILFESNGSEKYIVFAALDEDGALITAGSSSVAAAYAIVGYTGLVSEVIVPDTYNDPSISEGDLPVTKVLAVDPYSDYKCSRNGSPYTGEDARLQNNTIITSIVFGSDVTYVGAGVCAGMTNLYSVRFEHAEDEVSIGNSAFALCPLDYINYGNIIYLGTFPQSRVTDSSLRSALTLAAGALPSNGNDQNWTSYKYYIGGSNSTDFMWFIDVSYGKEKYRGVYFTNYLPFDTTYSSAASTSYQDENGYTVGNVYWFKFEPIKWRMLCKANGNIFLLSELAIDGNAYHPSRSTRTIENVTVYPNNYKYSNIRAWLNETFYETAFNNEQKSLILTTNVDNSARSTNPNDNATLWNGGVNNYACEDTQDKVFLLSVQEATNSVYGFRADPDSYDLAKCKKITDYGKAKGVFVNRESDYYGQVSWRLRSPYFQSENFPRYNNTFGYVGLSYEVTYTDFGIVPAMWIRPE